MSIFVRNFLICIGCAVLTVVFYGKYGSFDKPLMFSAIVGVLMILYYALFEKKGVERQSSENIEYKFVKASSSDSVDDIANKIKGVIKKIKAKAEDETKFMVVSRFMSEINEFEVTIPKLVSAYKRGKKYIDENIHAVNREMGEIEHKYNSSSGAAKEIYEKTLREKQATVAEIENIKSNLDETESKMYYIFTTLQKIETTIESVELKDTLSDKEVSDLNGQLELFSSGFKDIVNSMKL